MEKKLKIIIIVLSAIILILIAMLLFRKQDAVRIDLSSPAKDAVEMEGEGPKTVPTATTTQPRVGRSIDITNGVVLDPLTDEAFSIFMDNGYVNAETDLVFKNAFEVEGVAFIELGGTFEPTVDAIDAIVKDVESKISNDEVVVVYKGMILLRSGDQWFNEIDTDGTVAPYALIEDPFELRLLIDEEIEGEIIAKIVQSDGTILEENEVVDRGDGEYSRILSFKKPTTKFGEIVITKVTDNDETRLKTIPVILTEIPGLELVPIR